MYMYNGLCDVICVGASKVLVKGGMCVFPNDDSSVILRVWLHRLYVSDRLE